MGQFVVVQNFEPEVMVLSWCIYTLTLLYKTTFPPMGFSALNESSLLGIQRHSPDPFIECILLRESNKARALYKLDGQQRHVNLESILDIP